MVREIIHTAFIESFSEGWLGICLGVLVWVCFLIISGLVLWGLFYVVDTVGVGTEKTTAQVFDKSHHDAYTSFMPMMVGKITMLMPQHHPERWEVSFSSGKGSDSISVSKEFFESAVYQDWYEVEYKSGRLSGGFYLTQIIRKLS